MSWLYPFPDPYAEGDDAASYVTTAVFRRFMGDQLVEYRTALEGSARTNSLWIIGDTSALAVEDTLLAEDTVSNSHIVNDLHMGATVDKMFVGLEDDETALVATYWVVGSDGSQSLVPPDEDLTEFDMFMVPDQRLEPDLRDYPFAGVNLKLQPVPTGTPEASVAASELDTNNALGSTWAAIILGDTSEERVQPDPPDPFDVTLTSVGFHTGDGAVVFDFSDETGDQFSIWENAQIAWSGDGANAPTMNFGFIGVETVLLDIARDDGGGQSTPLPIDGTRIDQYRSAYVLDTLGGNARGGQLSVFFDPSLNPDTPSDYMDTVSATITGTRTIEPAAAHAYTQGEYRYIRNGLDDQSTYVDQEKGAPGSEYMWSQLFEAVNGRWTGVVSLQQDGDNYGDGTACSFCVYFESFGGVAFAPPLRQYPRSDGLAASSVRRLYPPARSIQHSNRRAGGYL